MGSKWPSIAYNHPEPHKADADAESACRDLSTSGKLYFKVSQ